MMTNTSRKSVSSYNTDDNDDVVMTTTTMIMTDVG